MEKAKGHLALAGANSMWGLMSPIAKMVMLGGIITPFVMTDLRVFGAMLLFWLASLFFPYERVPFRDLLKMFAASILAIVFNQGSFILGVGLTSPVNASIITTSMPLITMIISAIYLKEPITGLKVGGIAAGASGALLLVMSGSGTGSAAGDIRGDLLVLLAQCSYALYMVLFKNFIARYSVVTLMKWMFTFASLVLLPFTYDNLVATQWLELPWSDIAGCAFVVVGGTFISYLLMLVGLRRLRPTVAGMYNYVQPIVATIFAVLWGLDAFTWQKTVSVVLIFFGVYLVTKSKSRADMEAEKVARKE